MEIKLSVVIPSYNETENLKRGALEEVRDYLLKQDFNWEVIVIDDESPDWQSRKLAKEFCESNKGFVFIEGNHGGKAVTVWTGIQKAHGELVLFTDMDQSTPISEFDKVRSYFDKGYDVAIGSRGLERKNFALFRQVASFIFRNVRRTLLLRRIIDTQAGFKCLKRSVALEVFPKLAVIKNIGVESKGWTVGSFDVEMLVIAEVLGYKIAEVPVLWQDRDESIAKAKERKEGKFIKESIDMFKEVLRVKYNQLAGNYKRS